MGDQHAPSRWANIPDEDVVRAMIAEELDRVPAADLSMDEVLALRDLAAKPAAGADAEAKAKRIVTALERNPELFEAVRRLLGPTPEAPEDFVVTWSFPISPGNGEHKTMILEPDDPGGRYRFGFDAVHVQEATDTAQRTATGVNVTAILETVGAEVRDEVVLPAEGFPLVLDAVFPPGPHGVRGVRLTVTATGWGVVEDAQLTREYLG